MKVAIVVHQFPPRHTTGTERYAYTLARGLEKRGLSVVVFTGEDDGRSLLAEADYVVGGLAVHRLTVHRSLEPDPIRGEYASALAEAAFDRFLEAERPDLVHVFHAYNLGGGVMDAAWARGVPYLVHLMDYWFLCPRIQMLDHEGSLCPGPRTAARCARCASTVDGNYRPLVESPDAPGLDRLGERWPWLRARLERAARVIAPSRYLRDRFVENGLDPEQVVHLPYGVDVPAAPGADPAGGLEGRAGGEFRFGYLGNLATFKGAHLALEAFTRVEGEHLRLHVHGDFFFREPEQMEVCRRRVEQDGRISMRGRYEPEQLAAILAGLDVVVVPSLWHENTPFVVLEALRSGTPVIASRVGGIVEVVRDGEDGLLFERGDAADLARQMRRYAAGDAPAQVSADHIPSLDANLDALLAHYRSAAEDPRRPAAADTARVRAAQRDGLLEAIQALGERLATAGGATGRGRGVVELLRGTARLRTELDAHRAALADRQEEIEVLRRDFAAIEADYRRRIAEHERRDQELGADLEGHRVALAQQRAELEAHRERAQALEAEFGGYRRDFAAVESALREDLERHRAAVAELAGEREAFRRVVADLEQDLDGHRKALHQARVAHAAVEADLRRANEQLRAARDEAGEQAAALRRLQARLDRYAAEIDTTAQGRNL